MPRARRRLTVAVVLLLGIVAAVWWSTSPHIHPDRFGVEIEGFEISSELVPATLEQVLVRPDSTSNALVVFLHGRGSSPEDMLSDELFAALDELGDDAPTVLFVDGGESSYYHDRDSGNWATYVVRDAIPAALERTDSDPTKVAIGGISMGGFGALSIALTGGFEFCAVGAHSPAIFESWESSAAGAFDDARDFESHDLLEALERPPVTVRGRPFWIDIGDDDPFRPTVTRAAELMDRSSVDLTFERSPGGHDESYWWAHMDDYMSFYADALASC